MRMPFQAVHKLETIASQNGFTIHDVPYDGNCMFSAIAYQLNSSGVCDVNSNGLRQTIAKFLKANKAQYWDFVCQPVAQMMTIMQTLNLQQKRTSILTALQTLNCKNSLGGKNI